MEITELCPVCSECVEVAIYWDGGDKSFGYTYKCPNCGTTFEIGRESGKTFRRKLTKHKFLFFEWGSWDEY